jgi:hypothetical protein
MPSGNKTILYKNQVTNSEGLESITQCQLYTYDNTLPEGKVVPSYPYSSHPHTLSATANPFDDSDLKSDFHSAVGLGPGQYGTELKYWAHGSLDIRNAGYSEFEHLNLTHGMVYFFTARVTNVLEYMSYLIGEGTMVDYTPPEPGPVGDVMSDVIHADNCNAAPTQRCERPTWLPNHRY